MTLEGKTTRRKKVPYNHDLVGSLKVACAQNKSKSSTLGPLLTPHTMTASDPNDDRPFIKDLLEEHSKAIASVKEIILADETGKEIYNKGDNPKRYDGIWTLRYLLSHKGNVKSSAKAALKTIKFREEHKMNELGDIRYKIRNLGTGDTETLSDNYRFPHARTFERCCGEKSIMITLHDPDRGPVLYVDGGKIDQNAMAETMDDEKTILYNLHYNEAIYQVLDHVTRKTGRLTRHLKVIDLRDVSLLSMNRAYLKRDGTSKKVLQDYHPQLLGSVYIANAPTWMTTLWTALKHFFPKRSVEKVEFLASESKLKSNKAYIKPLLRYVSEEDLPERYGGKNKEWPLPCISKQFPRPHSPSQ